jgi:hypothetical protein
VLTEQQQNGQNGQGQPRFSVDANSLQSGSENYGGSLGMGKHGSGEIRGSCEGSAVGSGEVVGAPVVSKASERKELMSPGNAATFSAWGSVTCAMAACFSPGVTVLQQTPGKDWLQDFDTANMWVHILSSFHGLVFQCSCLSMYWLLSVGTDVVNRIASLIVIESWTLLRLLPCCH